MPPNANGTNLESLANALKDQCAFLTSPLPLVESGRGGMISRPSNVNVSHPGMSGAGLSRASRNNEGNGRKGQNNVHQPRLGLQPPAAPLMSPPGVIGAAPAVTMHHNVHKSPFSPNAQPRDASFYRDPKNHPQHFQTPQQKQQQKQQQQPPSITEAVRHGAWTVGSTEGQNGAAGPPVSLQNSDDAMMAVERSTGSSDDSRSDMAHPQDAHPHYRRKNKKRPIFGATLSSGLRSVGGGSVKSSPYFGNGSQTQAVPIPASIQTTSPRHHQTDINPFVSLYEDKLFNRPNTTAVESVLAAACEGMGFEIAEMWLRTGPKTHQLVHSHVRPTALEEQVAAELVEVYYGEQSCDRTHRLSPALCKRAKEAMDVVWVTAHTEHGADALKCSISDVRTAVAIPVCHVGSNTNITLIYFSVRRAVMRPPAVEFFVHMSLSSATVAVNSFPNEVFVDRTPVSASEEDTSLLSKTRKLFTKTAEDEGTGGVEVALPSSSSTRLDMKWAELSNVEYLTDGGNNWIHTAVVDGKPVVVKTLKPECQDVALAINELESELEIHSKLIHPNIVQFIGAGLTSKGNRFVVMERLDGGTLSQVLGYDTRIRDRRRRFWRKRLLSYHDVLFHARSLADALAYCHGRAIPNKMILHRDLKPDNVGFTLDGTLKLLDFGLSRMVENATPFSNDVYHMSGETGSLRYMAPEVADTKPYNNRADVYSFGVILWELITHKKPYEGMNRETFLQRVVQGGERPPLNHRKWPKELCNLLQDCWHVDLKRRPNMQEIVERLDAMLQKEQEARKKSKHNANKYSSASSVASNVSTSASLMDRHSTWF